jgi:hypothetical protein
LGVVNGIALEKSKIPIGWIVLWVFAGLDFFEEFVLK